MNVARCNLCKHRCVIPEGKTGICGTIGNENGKLISYVKYFPAAIHLDPIEKKPLFHFYPGSLVYSIGTFGCNFRCSFCQNWELSQFPKVESQHISSKAKVLIRSNSLHKTPEEIVHEALRLNSRGIAYTYNEPTIWAEYAAEISDLAHRQGLFNVFVSSGYETNETLDMLKYIDAYNIDIKAFTKEFYLKYCGTRLDYVLDTIKEIYKRKKWIELTTLVIPGENNNDLEDIALFIKNELDNNVPWHITAFHPDYKMKDKQPTPYYMLENGFRIAKKVGLNYVYLGNVFSNDRENTYCPKCNTLLIERHGFKIVKNNLVDGRCPVCKTKISGFFD